MKTPGDFSAEGRLVWISLVAVLIGALCTVVAIILLSLIALFTNLFYFQELSLAARSPADNTLGAWAILIPPLGGLLIGLMARYGSDRIRGHGIPEAMEAILIGQSRMQPKVAILKPLSSAISIGSGGPFGAEGPIIMTGGAVGSLIAQAIHLTSAERKTLLVAGAVGGMTAIFSTPVAAVLLGVELLLFEWKPRSLIPIALAAVTANLLRPYLLESGPLFPVPMHEQLSFSVLAVAPLFGLVMGALASVLTLSVYACEDGFHKLPIHWMWWPIIGGLAVGVGGYFEPRVLGVGYDILRDLLTGHYVRQALVMLVVVKAGIWAFSLGSGTSGGVFAPILIVGGGLGALLGAVLPGGDAALWPLIGMAAIIGGALSSPLTGAVFALEITHDIKLLPALLSAAIAAHLFTVLVMKRSILTEKIARRGLHVTREYAIDPFERMQVKDVMTREVISVSASLPAHALLTDYFLGTGPDRHQAYPVVDAKHEICGVVTKANLLAHWWANLPGFKDGQSQGVSPIIAYDLVAREPIVGYPHESCAMAAERMDAAGIGRLLIVTPENPRRLVGILTRSDLLKSRTRHLEEERKRERFFGGSRSSSKEAPAVDEVSTR